MKSALILLGGIGTFLFLLVMGPLIRLLDLLTSREGALALLVVFGIGVLTLVSLTLFYLFADDASSGSP